MKLNGKKGEYQKKNLYHMQELSTYSGEKKKHI